MSIFQVCPLCQTATANQEALDKHKAEFHQKCPHCPFSGDVEAHLETAHPTKVKCHACGFYNLDQG